MARLVRKRDGRIETWRDSKPAAAIERAIHSLRRRLDPDDRLLARELARSVAFFVDRRRGVGHAGLISSEEIGELVERSLRDTGHGELAERFADHSRWRRRRRDELASASGRERRSAADSDSGFSKARLLTRLERELGLAPAVASEVARRVEESVLALGLSAVSAGLVDELMALELAARGLDGRLGARLTRPGAARIEEALAGGQGHDPARFEARLSGDMLEALARDRIQSSSARRAMQAGLIAPATGGSFLRLHAVHRRLEPPRDEDGQILAPGLIELASASAALESDLERVSGRVTVTGFGAAVARLPASERGAAQALLASLATRRLSESTGSRLVLTGSLAELEWLLETGRDDAVYGLEEAGSPRARCRPAAGPVGGPLPETRPGVSAVAALGVLNLVRPALEAGRGELDGFMERIEAAAAALVSLLAERRRLIESDLLRPALPLWQPTRDDGARRTGSVELEAEDLICALQPIGLRGALRYLTGEDPSENPRVEELGVEILRELARALRAESRPSESAPVLEPVAATREAGRFAERDLLDNPRAVNLGEPAEVWSCGLDGLSPAARSSALAAFEPSGSDRRG